MHTDSVLCWVTVQASTSSQPVGVAADWGFNVSPVETPGETFVLLLGFSFFFSMINICNLILVESKQVNRAHFHILRKPLRVFLSLYTLPLGG